MRIYKLLCALATIGVGFTVEASGRHAAAGGNGPPQAVQPLPPNYVDPPAARSGMNLDMAFPDAGALREPFHHSSPFSEAFLLEWPDHAEDAVAFYVKFEPYRHTIIIARPGTKLSETMSHYSVLYYDGQSYVLQASHGMRCTSQDNSLICTIGTSTFTITGQDDKILVNNRIAASTEDDDLELLNRVTVPGVDSKLVLLVILHYTLLCNEELNMFTD